MSISKINFKKLLPTGMRSTKWGDFILAYQDTYDEVKTNKILNILDRYIVDSASNDELKDIAYMLGFNLLTLDGYTSTNYYLQREISTIVKRIKSKTTPLCYNYISMVFDLLGSINITSDTELNEVSYLFYEATSMFAPVPTIDLPDLILDSDIWPTLDSETFSKTVTRSMIYNYKPKFIENTTEFLSENTLKVLTNDINQAKKATESIYYQPILEVSANRADLITSKLWTSYDTGIERSYDTVLLQDDFSASAIELVRFGNSFHANSTSGIADVNNFIWALSGITNVDFDITKPLDVQPIDYSDDYLDFQMLIKYYQKLPVASGITEAAFFNSSGEILLYTSFPLIQWDPSSYGSLRVQLTLV
jgi:hypothetical protein